MNLFYTFQKKENIEEERKKKNVVENNTKLRHLL